VREAGYLLSRALRRLDLMSRSTFSVVDEGACFAGPLFELLLASDRVYVLESAALVARASAFSGEAGLRWNGQSRLAARFLANPDRVASVLERGQDHPFTSDDLQELGLATESFDDFDYDDGLRVAVEERASLSPDALIGMESSTRFGGPETMATRIFGRLSAWQNWIFTRANATGPTGALTLYGKPERPKYDFTRA
jgi:benzoyl-CoA-dihydrodiol lyase